MIVKKSYLLNPKILILLDKTVLQMNLRI